MEVEAEVGLYPLGQKELGRGVKAFIQTLKEQGCYDHGRRVTPRET